MRWRWPSAASLDARWQTLWRAFDASPEGHALRLWLEARVAAGATVVPEHTLHALALTPFDAVRVVILGQDPYHGPDQAHGLAFSVPVGQRIPPSLRNIHAEIERDLRLTPPTHGNLEAWARQGVLLLNAVLTVELGAPASHAQQGWESFTRAVVQAVAQDPAPKVFLLWGAFAQKFSDLIAGAGAHHGVFKANHPSPLSARRPPVPFLGCGHFSKANDYLQNHGLGSVDWSAEVLGGLAQLEDGLIHGPGEDE